MPSKQSKQFVIFDLFGTLVQFGIQHHPYRQLLKWARDTGRKPKPDDARTIMTINGDLEAVSAVLGISPPNILISTLQDQINEELTSLKLFHDVLPTLTALEDQNVQVGICSNLAQPYGRAMDDLLSEFDFRRFLSYELGCIKPETKIYHEILKTFECTPRSCLFVGDTYDADYLGALSVGMSALHLRRNGESQPNQVASLAEVLGGQTLKQFNPPHPGEIIQRVYMEPLDLSLKALAMKLEVPAINLKQLIDGEIDVDVDWSSRLSKGLGRSPDSWILMQKNYDNMNCS